MNQSDKKNLKNKDFVVANNLTESSSNAETCTTVNPGGKFSINVMLYSSYSNSGALSLTSNTWTSTLAVADRNGLSVCVA